VAHANDCVFRSGSSALQAHEPNLKTVVVVHASMCVHLTYPKYGNYLYMAHAKT
jgi:hypothetical protein